MTSRALVAVGWVAIAVVVGCQTPGISGVSRIEGSGGATGSMLGTPATATGAGGSTTSAPITGAGGMTSAPIAGAGGMTSGASAAGAGGSPMMGASGTGAGGSPMMGASGTGAGGSMMMGTAGTGAGGMGAGGSPGTGGAGEVLPACPTGWKCQDPFKALADMGADGMVTDSSGNPVSNACGVDGLVDCDPADPEGSCAASAGAQQIAALSKPFCAHIVTTGLLAVDLYSCAQLCTP